MRGKNQRTHSGHITRVVFQTFSKIVRFDECHRYSARELSRAWSVASCRIVGCNVRRSFSPYSSVTPLLCGALSFCAYLYGRRALYRSFCFSVSLPIVHSLLTTKVIFVYRELSYMVPKNDKIDRIHEASSPCNTCLCPTYTLYPEIDSAQSKNTLATPVLL